MPDKRDPHAGILDQIGGKIDERLIRPRPKCDGAGFKFEVAQHDMTITLELVKRLPWLTFFGCRFNVGDRFGRDFFDLLR